VRLLDTGFGELLCRWWIVAGTCTSQELSLCSLLTNNHLGRATGWALHPRGVASCD
jgi:hypothetical protein